MNLFLHLSTLRACRIANLPYISKLKCKTEKLNKTFVEKRLIRKAKTRWHKNYWKKGKNVDKQHE